MARTFFLGAGALYLSLGFALGTRGALLAWLGASLLIIGIAYVRRAPGLLGKRADGTFHPFALLVHAPFLAAAWVSWQLRRRRSEPAWNEVAPRLFVGRMSTPAELPPDSPWVVDLTCELLPPRALRGARYRCLPTLDGTAPEHDAFWRLVDELAALDAPIFIHCAAGHGRSATLAAAVMLARGQAHDVNEAEALLKRRRPRIALGRLQRALVDSRPAALAKG